MKEKQVLFSITPEKNPSENRERETISTKTEEWNPSLWIEREQKQVGCGLSMEQLPTRVEVLVVGGGMAGMLTAYELIQQGRDVLVIERDSIGAHSSGHTTAKLTSLHGGNYHKIISGYSMVKAKQYYDSQEAAIDRFQQIIEQEDIACDFERKNHILYTTNQLKQLETEYECLKQLGIACDWIQVAPLPFQIQGGITFPEQAQFHPVKFLQALASKVKVIEGCQMTRLDSDGTVEVNHTKEVKAEYVVIATHYPIINSKGMFFTKLDQERSYVLALEQPQGFDLQDMYIELEETGHSFRRYKEFLIMGVGNHRSGDKSAKDYYQQLEGEALTWYPDSTVVAKWSNQDTMSLDSIPYIGRYSRQVPNLYVACGFNQWGMTNSMVAAGVLTDLICKGASPYEELYSPCRHSMSEAGKLLKNIGISTVNLSKQLLHCTDTKLEQLAHGEAAIVKYDGKVLGAYKDEDEVVNLVDAKCPHLGCQLAWNPSEKTWDCPCHGSRFDIHGHWIEAPTQKDLGNVCCLKKIETQNKSTE